MTKRWAPLSAALLAALAILCSGCMAAKAKGPDELQQELERYLEEREYHDPAEFELSLLTEEVRPVEGEDAYHFEQRHKADAEGYDNSLIAYYAITLDGSKVYYINPAMEEYQQLQ